MVESNNQPTKWSGCLQGSCQKMLEGGGATNSHKYFIIIISADVKLSDFWKQHET